MADSLDMHRKLQNRRRTLSSGEYKARESATLVPFPLKNTQKGTHPAFLAMETKHQEDMAFVKAPVDINIDDALKELEQINKPSITIDDVSEDNKVLCHGIIHGAAGASGVAAAGLAQIPFSDAAIITPIQIAMVISLGSVFGVNLTEGMAKGILAGCAAAFAGRGISQALIGWIPGVGNAVNATTAITLTEAIGWYAVKHFHEDRDKIVWKKEGYCQASEAYEEKLAKQAEDFLMHRQNAKDCIEELRDLIAAYEMKIEKLEHEISKTNEECEQLSEMIKTKDKLQKMYSEATSIDY